jgi:hypothetical protein
MGIRKEGDLLCCYSSLSGVCGGVGVSVLQAARGAGMWGHTCKPPERIMAWATSLGLAGQRPCPL